MISDCSELDNTSGEDYEDEEIEGGSNGKYYLSPIPFCSHIFIPKGFMPVRQGGQPVVSTVILNTCLFLHESTEKAPNTNIPIGLDSLNCEVDLLKTSLVGCFTVQTAIQAASVNKKRYAYFCVQNDLCLDEELYLSCLDTNITPDNVALKIRKKTIVVICLKDYDDGVLYEINGEIDIHYDLA